VLCRLLVTLVSLTTITTLQLTTIGTT